MQSVFGKGVYATAPGDVEGGDVLDNRGVPSQIGIDQDHLAFETEEVLRGGSFVLCLGEFGVE